MEENKNQDLAGQTEIPVSEAPNIQNNVGPKKGFSFANLPVKIVLPVVAVFVIIVIVVGFLVMRKPVTQEDLLGQEFRDAYIASDYDKAAEIAKEKLAENPDSAEINGAIIDSISAKGNLTGTETQSLEESKEYIEKALSSNPDSLQVLTSVGYAYEAAGEYEKALEYYTKLTELYPDSSEAWFRLGHVLQFLGRNEEANTYYEKSYQIDPNQPLIMLIYAKNYIREGNINEAWDMYYKITKDTTINRSIRAEAYSAASEISRGRGAFDYALINSKLAIEVDPSSSLAHGIHGYNLAITGSPLEGIDFLKKAISLNPRISRNYNDIAQIYRVQGNYSESVNYHELAIDKVDSDNTILDQASRSDIKGRYIYELARTYDMSGLSVDILPMIQDALSKNPSLRERLRNDVNTNGSFLRYLGNVSFESLLND